MSKYIILFFFLLSTFGLFSQIDKNIFFDSGNPLYYSIYQQGHEKGDSISLKIGIRISWNLLKFIKTNLRNNPSDSYSTHFSIDVEFRDSNGIIRKRIVRNDSVLNADYSEINRKDKFIYYNLNTNLLNGSYKPVIRVYDIDKTKLYEVKPVEITKQRDTKIGELSSPLFANTKEDRVFNEIILNNCAGFSSNDIKIIYHMKNSMEGDYYFRINFLDSNNSPVAIPDNNQANGKVWLIRNSNLEFATTPSGSVINCKETNDISNSVMVITCSADRTIPGSYRLTVWNENSKDTITADFRIVWESMPSYLFNPVKAVEVMYYILTNKEYDELRKGSNKEILMKIFEWWKQKDPSKFSIYNEAMVQYFVRAEQASRNFKTNFEKDGALTDRGKIYILYGPPDNSSSEMQVTGRSIEIWSYKGLGKQFIFNTDKNGIIYLTDIKTN
jgi:GWxTD domain-containing protein